MNLYSISRHSTSSRSNHAKVDQDAVVAGASVVIKPNNIYLVSPADVVRDFG
jgi:hypothetical protein